MCIQFRLGLPVGGSKRFADPSFRMSLLIKTSPQLVFRALLALFVQLTWPNKGYCRSVPQFLTLTLVRGTGFQLPNAYYCHLDCLILETFVSQKIANYQKTHQACYTLGRDSAVGIAARYGLGCPGSNPGGDEISLSIRTGPGNNPASYTMGTGSFQGVKRPGRGVDHPPASSVEVKERVELFLYSTSGLSWPVLG